MAKSKKKGFNVNKAIGLGLGIFAAKRLDDIDMVANQDPRMVNGGKVFLGLWAPDQPWLKKIIDNDDIRDGLGMGIAAQGGEALMGEFGISGMGQANNVLKDDDFLLVAVEGDYDEYMDEMYVDEDILAEDEDIDTINDDEEDYEEDIDTVNEDVLADDYL